MSSSLRQTIINAFGGLISSSKDSFKPFSKNVSIC